VVGIGSVTMKIFLLKEELGDENEKMKNVVAVTVIVIALMAIIVPVSTALEEVEWKCYQIDEPLTSGMERTVWAKTNPEDKSSFICVPVDRNIGLPKSKLVKCKCDIWSDIDDIDVISFFTDRKAYIWAIDCGNIKHCECTEAEEYTLTLEHYPPYSEPKGDLRRAGDLVATLKDKNGKGVSGKTVFFYVESETNLWGVLENTICPLHLDWALIDYYFPNLSYFGDADTNNEGIARFNYIKYRCVKADILSERIRDAGENIKGPVVAAVFNQELTAIEQDASVVVEFSGVARITEVSVHGDYNEIEWDERKVRVAKEGRNKAVYDRKHIPKGGLPNGARCTPYDLLCGDAIFLDKNDCVELLWLSGLKMKIKTKPSVLGDNLAKVTIGRTGLADVWEREIYGYTRSGLFNTVILGGVGLAISTSYPISAAVIGVAQPVMYVAQWFVGETPFVITVQESTILADFDETKATFYTVEGTNRILNPNDLSMTTIPTGHKISVSSDGTLGPVSEFDRSELNDDLSYLLDEIEGKPHKPRPTSAPVSTSTPIPTPKPTPVRRSTPTESTPAQEPTTQEECERWCSSKYGAGTPWMFSNIDGCVCRGKEGYGLNAEGRRVKITIEECDQKCIDKFGVGGVGAFNSDEMCRCVCREGYEFNKEKAKYIKITSTQTVKPTTQEECEKWCSSKYGAGVPGIFINNGCFCRCKEGYTRKGVKITLEQYDQLCFDEFGIGHMGALNFYGKATCVCSEGYILNEAKTKCIKRTPTPTKKPQPAPTYNYDDDYTYTEPVPGFKAVFAIAGLLAVAYLVLRKRK
jgi:PGF-CTERM protein